LSNETLHRWHKRLFWLWIGPGTVVSVILVLLTGQKTILIWNLIVSMYTVSIEHFLGMRQEKE
jgi:hypothetical protein